MKANIAVFAASSANAPQSYYEAAYQSGKAFAQNNYTVFYGAGLGIMNSMADGVIDNHGRIIGIIPECLYLHYPSAVEARLSVNNTQQQLIVTEDIERRKDLLIKDTDVVVALPGGVGTFEELYDACSRGKKVILLNHEGYYDDLLAQHSSFSFIEAKTAEEVIDHLDTLKHANWSSIDFTLSLDTVNVNAVKKVCEEIESNSSFLAVHDESHSFISVMTQEQYKQFNISQNEQSRTEQLFLSATHLFIFEHDHPVTYAILHKMLTYNQLGLHGKKDGKQIHKNIFLLTTEGSSFFEPTYRQLDRAIDAKLLTRDHILALKKVKLECNAILQSIQKIHLEVAETSWWKKKNENAATESNRIEAHSPTMP